VRTRSADLEWVAGMLAAPPTQATVGRPGSLDAAAAYEMFGVFPTAARPRLLVPLASKRAAAASLRGPSQAREPQVRLARFLLRIGIRAGVAQHLLRDRLLISLGREKETSDLLADVLLSEHLTEIFGRRDIVVAVRVRQVRPNRKPLVQVLTPDGDVLGYVKVGWNSLTRLLVRNEARVLADLARVRSSRLVFEVPRILHSGEWRQLEILALSPLHGRWFRRSRSFIAAVGAAMNEISGLSVGDERQLAGSDYWRAERTRIKAAPNRVRLDQLADIIEERYGMEVLAFGSWHGDWTPWNMGWRGGTLAIWDWERSAPAVPIGLDAAHFDFQVALRATRQRSATALRRTLAGNTPLLSSLSLPRKRHRLLLSLHLLEMSLRCEEGRRAGMSPPDSTYLPTLAALLEGAHERL
jgi:Phosphotransferase enzyme family